MVFGTNKKLQDDLFCLTEERDYFQGKFLEQVSEIAALKDELAKSKKEITKLRQQLMDTSMSSNISSSPDATSPKSSNANKSRPSLSSKRNHDTEENDEEAEEANHASDGHEDHNDDESAHTTSQDESVDEEESDNDDDDEIEDEEDRKAQDIRQSAEKLLQWATYRSSVVGSSINTPTTRTLATDRSSVSDTSSLSQDQDQPFDVPRTIQSESLEIDTSSRKEQQEQQQGNNNTSSTAATDVQLSPTGLAVVAPS